MAITIDGAVGRVAELYGEIPSVREMRWLWMRLKFFSDSSPNQFSLFPNFGGKRAIKHQGQFLGGGIDFELEKLLEKHAESIGALRMTRLFNQIDDFDWVDESDVRQLCWLIDRIQEGLNVEVPDARARLSNREYFICLVDLVEVPVLDKKNYLSGLNQAWILHQKSTSYLNWFNDDEDPGRCDFAWEALESRLKQNSLSSFQFNQVIGHGFRRYKGGAGVKCYFDALQLSDYEKKSHVDHVKRLWNQRKYREKLEKNKLRQRNFVLSDTTIKSLDKLAKELGLSRTEALERLIELASRYGMPHAPARSNPALESPGFKDY